MTLTRKQRRVLDAICFLVRRGELPTVREVAQLVGLRSPSTAFKHLLALREAGYITMTGKSRGIRIADPGLLRSLIAEAGEGWDDASTGKEADIAERKEEAKKEEAGSSSPGARGRTKAATAAPDDDLEDLAPEARGNLLQSHLRKFWGYGRIPVVGAIAAGLPIEMRAEAFTSPTDFEDYPALSFDPHLFADSGMLLGLRVEGDSMIDAGILDGDLAIIRRQDEVEDGEIAAVLINGEATLKRWRFSFRTNAKRAKRHLRYKDYDVYEEDGDGPGGKGSILRLVPANTSMDPLEITEADQKDIMVIGKYVGLVRGVRLI